ncbi:MAG: TfoX/Sxy family protein [Proteobacteria bacterium]|nr:TfoX/Sxy family protein [Pseudomonadota bacterium]
MALSGEYLDYVLEQLAALGSVRARRMFGGAGLYCDDLFFGIVSGDTLYLRADDLTRAHYTSRALEPFRPYPERPEVSMNYFAVPAEILEDASELTQWGRQSVAVAARAGAPGAPRTRRKRSRARRRGS